MLRVSRPEPGKYGKGFLNEKPLSVLPDSFERTKSAEIRHLAD
jgi:hypothetical protein